MFLPKINLIDYNKDVYDMRVLYFYLKSSLSVSSKFAKQDIMKVSPLVNLYIYLVSNKPTLHLYLIEFRCLIIY